MPRERRACPPVRVERCGKSAPDDGEPRIAVNSIRSNTVEEAHGWPGRFREVAGTSWQQGVKIDDCQIQNPAYSFSRQTGTARRPRLFFSDVHAAGKMNLNSSPPAGGESGGVPPEPPGWKIFSHMSIHPALQADAACYASFSGFPIWNSIRRIPRRAFGDFQTTIFIPSSCSLSQCGKLRLSRYCKVLLLYLLNGRSMCCLVCKVFQLPLFQLPLQQIQPQAISRNATVNRTSPVGKTAATRIPAPSAAAHIPSSHGPLPRHIPTPPFPDKRSLSNSLCPSIFTHQSAGACLFIKTVTCNRRANVIP